MKKAEILTHWRGLGERPAPSKVMRAVPYKHEGSTYSEDGVRITGSQAFIDSVLYRLRDLLERENDTERLQVAYQESTDRQNPGLKLGSWNCYVQVHERGQEAKYVDTMYGRS
ncbi:MAG: hypothetical protein Q8R28_15160 [Dehalococcoidia bacterium]|nr:hypothetical protein [Dehalococcoidia bacterium]